MVTGTRKRPSAEICSGIASSSAGLHFLTSICGRSVKGEAPAVGDNLHAVTDAELLVDLRREIHQQAGVLAGYDALAPLARPLVTRARLPTQVR